MPVPFPTLDPATGELVTRDYFTIEEVAELLHMSPSTVRRRILDHAWPSLSIAQSHYMSAEHVAAVVAMHTVDPAPAVREDPAPPKLGTPLTDADLEGMT